MSDIIGYICRVCQSYNTVEESPYKKAFLALGKCINSVCNDDRVVGSVYVIEDKYKELEKGIEG